MTQWNQETISQYDSTLDREHGHFQIGSITPGLTFDFRNNRINPTKGAYFNLTCEFANPTFLSQKKRLVNSKQTISNDMHIFLFLHGHL